MDPFTLLLIAGAGYLILRGKAKPGIGAMAANMTIPPPEPFTPFPPFEPDTGPGGVGGYAGPGLQIVAPRPVQPIGTVSAPTPRPLPPTQPAPEVSPIGSIGGTILAPTAADISTGSIEQASV